MNTNSEARSTPGATWRQAGEPDPHAGHYDCERAKLTMGHLTDDELANGAFLNYDQPLNVQGILAGTHSSPIAWMTAVKDRIRWLSRALAQAEQERDGLAAKLAELEGQEPVGEIIHSDVLPGRDGAYRHELLCDFRLGVQTELFARPVPTGPVNERLLKAVTNLLSWIDDYAETSDPCFAAVEKHAQDAVAEAEKINDRPLGD